MAAGERPVLLYSIGKDSSVLLHLARKAFHPAPAAVSAAPRRHHLEVQGHVRAPRAHGPRSRHARLIVHTNAEGLAAGVTPFTHGSSYYTDVMKTEALRQALDAHRFDVIFGGARRDEEASRAKERICSFRSQGHRWDPKAQRPELWAIYNLRIHPGESIRVFPLSNWTELDIWRYIEREPIPIVPLYFAEERPVVDRDGTLIMVDDERFPLLAGEQPQRRLVRFRTLGCYPLSGAIESPATTVAEIVAETAAAAVSERQGRLIDSDQPVLDGEEEAGGLLLSAALLRLITCGSVDDGKSTLIGRLLYESRRGLRGSAARARSRLAPVRHAGRAPRFRAARRWPAGRARAGHHHRRRLSLLRHRRRDGSSSPTRPVTSSTRATWRPARRPRTSPSS